jgi:hypothetical protein
MMIWSFIFLSLLMACMADAAAVQPLRYVVRCGTDPLALDAVLLVDDETVTLTNLQPGLTYFVTVTAVREDGAMSEPSALISYEVPAVEDAPAVASGPVRVTVQGSDDLTEWVDEATLYQPRAGRKFYRLKIER